MMILVYKLIIIITIIIVFCLIFGVPSAYPVVMEAPEVSVHNLSQASVKPHLTYEGRDSPEMYQIQYRVCINPIISNI